MKSRYNRVRLKDKLQKCILQAELLQERRAKTIFFQQKNRFLKQARPLIGC